jgi:transcriptional regulator with XRE-family HTH domain
VDKKLIIEVGQRIRDVRKHMLINQTDFARSLGITAAYLSAMENGKIEPDFEFLYKVEKFFNVNLLYIITGKGPILPLWERPAIKMCEGLLKTNGEEFRELIRTMYESPEIYRDVMDYFIRSHLQQNDSIKED